MRLFRRVVLVFAILLLVITAVGLFFFDEHIHVERSILINQSRTDLFSMLNNYQNFQQWSPWLAKDPNAKVSLSGAQSGKGAKVSWSSEVKDVGNGSMTIVDSYADSLIRHELEFFGRGRSVVAYRFENNGSATKMFWTLDMNAGANPVLRIMGGFMDKMIGPDFEKGLMKLKQIAESNPQQVMK